MVGCVEAVSPPESKLQRMEGNSASASGGAEEKKRAEESEDEITSAAPAAPVSSAGLALQCWAGFAGSKKSIDDRVSGVDSGAHSGADSGATKQRKLVVWTVRPTVVSVKMDPECTSAQDFEILCEHDPFKVDYVKRNARWHFQKLGAVPKLPRGVKPMDYLKVARTEEKLDWWKHIGSRDDEDGEQVNQEFLDGNDDEPVKVGEISNDDEPVKVEETCYNIHKLTDGCTTYRDGYQDPLPLLQLIYVRGHNEDHVMVHEGFIDVRSVNK